MKYLAIKLQPSKLKENFVYVFVKLIIHLQIKILEMKKFISIYYPIILAFICMLYSIGLHLAGEHDDAQYSAHWPGTILLFAIAIRQRRVS